MFWRFGRSSFSALNPNCDPMGLNDVLYFYLYVEVRHLFICHSHLYPHAAQSVRARAEWPYLHARRAWMTGLPPHQAISRSPFWKLFALNSGIEKRNQPTRLHNSSTRGKAEQRVVLPFQIWLLWQQCGGAGYGRSPCCWCMSRNYVSPLS